MTKEQDKRQKHLANTIVGNVGALKAFRVMMFISCWGMAMKGLGRAPENIEEYSTWWEKSRATGYREQELFREALPMYETPTPICEWLAAEDAKIFNTSGTLSDDESSAVVAFRVAEWLL
jgi:hypothetical protein